MSSLSALSSSALQPATRASLNAPAASTASSSSSPTSTNSFMQLLMAQMQNQDPSSPTSPTDYVTQMAQFQMVQGMTQLNQSISSLVTMQSLSQSVNLIGKTVTYTNAAGQTANGAVTSVTLVGGQPQLVINNTNVAMTQVQSVAGKAKSGTTSGT